MNTVYKYCGARGVSILENLELKITPRISSTTHLSLRHE